MHSMYGMFIYIIYIWLICMVNVGRSTIHIPYTIHRVYLHIPRTRTFQRVLIELQGALKGRVSYK